MKKTTASSTPPKPETGRRLSEQKLEILYGLAKFGSLDARAIELLTNRNIKSVQLSLKKLTNEKLVKSWKHKFTQSFIYSATGRGQNLTPYAHYPVIKKHSLTGTNMEHKKAMIKVVLALELAFKDFITDREQGLQKYPTDYGRLADLLIVSDKVIKLNLPNKWKVDIGLRCPIEVETTLKRRPRYKEIFHNYNVNENVKRVLWIVPKAKYLGIKKLHHDILAERKAKDKNYKDRNYFVCLENLAEKVERTGEAKNNE